MASKLIFTFVLPVFLSTLVVLNFLSQKQTCFDKNGQFEFIPILGAVGPESFAFDSLDGGPYTGISDGRIIKWQGSEEGWIDYALTSPNRDGCGGAQDHDHLEHICGRPLGLHFNEITGDLFIADAYMGLLKVGPKGGLASAIATNIQNTPIRFANGLDIDQSTGLVYFTDSSSRYHRRNYISVILSGDKSGRLMKYEPQSQRMTVLLGNLSFPNGVVLSKDGNFILFAETTSCRILKYWIKTSKAGSIDVFAQLPGFPDNIKRSPRGGYWVGIHSKKVKLIGWVLSYPWIGNALLKLPFDITKGYSILAKYRWGGLAVRLDENGEVVEMIGDKDGNRFISISEVMEKDGKLWIGSINAPFVVNYEI